MLDMIRLDKQSYELKQRIMKSDEEIKEGVYEAVTSSQGGKYKSVN